MMKAFTRAVFLAMIVSVACCMIGCAKDAVVGFANAVMTNLGDNALTRGYNLTGRRVFDTDAYTGVYLAEYAGSTVRETLFGSTSLERQFGNTVLLSAHLTQKDGKGRLMLRRDGQEPEVLLDTTGCIETPIEVSPGSAYILFEGEDFSGVLDLTLEDQKEASRA